MELMSGDFMRHITQDTSNNTGHRQCVTYLPYREADRLYQLYQNIREGVLKLNIEVNCRIEHGASSGGHLEYVQSQLDEILKPA